MVSDDWVKRLYSLVAFTVFTVGAGCASAQEILLSPNLCRNAAQYQPVDDILAKPGQGRGGVIVTPPDLNAAGQDIADGIVANTLRVQLTADVAQKLGLQSPEEVDAEAPLGTLVYRGGQIYFNDIAVDGVDNATVRTLCRSAMR